MEMEKFKLEFSIINNFILKQNLLKNQYFSVVVIKMILITISKLIQL